jgi:hypothetical protein
MQYKPGSIGIFLFEEGDREFIGNPCYPVLLMRSVLDWITDEKNRTSINYFNDTNYAFEEYQNLQACVRNAQDRLNQENEAEPPNIIPLAGTTQKDIIRNPETDLRVYAV